jgi:hypothetical protein
MWGLLSALLLMSIAPTVLWIRHKKSKDSLWGTRQVGTVTVDPGGYREGVVPTFAPVEAPTVVRWAAIGAWTLGQLCVPAALLGVFVTLLTASSGGLNLLSALCVAVSYASFLGPEIVLAWRLLVLGSPLLRGERRAAAAARSAAGFASVLNGIVLSFMSLFLALYLAGSEVTLSGLLGFAAFISYPLLSVLHGALLRRAAAQLERHHTERAPPASSWVRIVGEPSAPFEPRSVEPATQSTDDADPARATRRG